ncbi:MAG TPA: amino acid adenylation domain-containing protein, partial [Thioploca sp.]|nr:amino acid adenylation domain-containing protein [Thioploca sp.]
LADWTAKADCLIDLEGHGRTALFDDIDLSRTVGWFTSIHPVALTLPIAFSDLGAALKAIKEQLRATPHDGIGYGLLTQLGGKVLPKGEILFNYLGQFDQGMADTTMTFANETTGSDVSLKGFRSHLIEINGAITQGELSLNWSYSGDCYFASTIQTLADRYQVHLQHLIAHCQSGQQGVTPSDFPLASVTQATLDVLYTQYAGLQDLYPLSPMQQGMLFHTLYEERQTGVYFEQMLLTLSNLEPTAFKAAWQHQLHRHPILRTAFLTEHEPILQVVPAQVPLRWREHDWRESSRETQQQLHELLQQERNQGFDLSQAPLMRFDLIRLDEQRYVFIQHHHHILMDGWCLPIMMSEVRDSYLAYLQGQTPQLPSRPPYREYIAWLLKQDRATAERYWQQRLAGFAAPTPLPIIAHQTETPLYREANYALSVENTRQLQRFSQVQRVTVNTLVQGAWALLLSRYSRESEVVFGVTVSGRHIPLSGIEQMMGLFINTLPLRLEAHPQDTVKDYLAKIQTQHQNDNQNAHSPLFEIQKVSEVPNGTALFDSLLVFENYPLGNALEEAAGFQIEDIQGFEDTNYPLTVAIMPGESLGFSVSYDSRRLNGEAIERLWGHMKTLLTAIVDNPEQSLSQLPMLTDKEIQQLQAWNDTATDYPVEKTIVDLFEQQVSKTPSNIAVVFENQQLTYQQLNDKANQLAHYLLALTTPAEIRSNNPLIAIAMERSLEMVIGLLGILKAGGAYVPIDPSYPAARIHYMLEDSAAPKLLTQSQLKAQLPLAQLQPECVVVCLDEAEFASQPTENPLVNRRPTDLAYVIYTSGSTGNPKGVMVEHSALSNFIHSSTNDYLITSDDKILQFSSVSFDAAAEEIYPTLSQGATLVLRTTEVLNRLETFLAFCTNQQLTVLYLSTAYWHSLLTDRQTTRKHWPDCLRMILIGGEAAACETVKQWMQHFRDYPALVNEYGPTETTIVAAYCNLGGRNLTTVPIGQPIANTRIYILSAEHQIQPPGILGELCIAGAGLARGYLNRPELSKEKFIEVELFGKTERIYKTGDLARWRPDGNLEYLGRIDSQVKLRGFR